MTGMLGQIPTALSISYGSACKCRYSPSEGDAVLQNTTLWHGHPGNLWHTWKQKTHSTISNRGLRAIQHLYSVTILLFAPEDLELNPLTQQICHSDTFTKCSILSFILHTTTFNNHKRIHHHHHKSCLFLATIKQSGSNHLIKINIIRSQNKVIIEHTSWKMNSSAVQFFKMFTIPKGIDLYSNAGKLKEELIFVNCPCQRVFLRINNTFITKLTELQ